MEYKTSLFVIFLVFTSAHQDTDEDYTTTSDYFNLHTVAEESSNEMLPESTWYFTNDTTEGTGSYFGSEPTKIHNETLNDDEDEILDSIVFDAVFVSVLSGVIILVISVTAVLVSTLSFKYFKRRSRPSSLSNSLLESGMEDAIETSIRTDPNIAYVPTVQDNNEPVYTSMVYNPLYSNHRPKPNENKSQVYASVRNV